MVSERMSLFLRRRSTGSDRMTRSMTSSSCRHYLLQTRDMRSFFLRMDLLSKRCTWDELQDDLAIVLNGNEAFLELFHQLFAQYSQDLPVEVLFSLACLVAVDKVAITSPFYSLSLTTFATFLAQRSVGDEIKLACLRVLMTLRCSHDPTPTWQLRDSVIQENLRFILDLEESLYLQHHSE